MQIAILDEWNPNVTERHPDLAYEPNRGAYRLTNDFGYYGEHGLRVASMAGAITDNNDGPTWMASVGWNTKLRGYHRADTLVKEAVRDGADVINCSWVVRFLYSDPYKTDLAEEVRSALEQGVVVVASAGNDERCTVCQISGGLQFYYQRRTTRSDCNKWHDAE
jgi:subtilisin family serine protease